MSDDQHSQARPRGPEPTQQVRPDRPAAARGPGGGGPFGGGMGMPAEKSLNFGPSAEAAARPDARRSGSG